MHIKEGIIPTVLGTVVTATGVALRNTDLPESYRNGLSWANEIELNEGY